MSINLLQIMVLAWIGLNIQVLFSAYKTKRWHYFAKQVINSIRSVLTMVWIFYYFILSVQTVAPVNQWALDWVATHPEQRDIVMLAPVVYVFTIIGIAIKAFWDMDKPIIKYNEQELAWRKEEKDIDKARLRKLMFWKHEKVA